MEDSDSLRPEDIRVDTFTTWPAEFHVVDEDPADPMAGRDEVVPNGNGHFTHV